MKKYLALAAILVLIPGLVQAQFNISAQIGGTPNMSATLLNFDGSLPSLVTLAGNAYLVTGTLAGNYSAPYFSGSTAAFFGESPANGPDASQYIAVEYSASATFSFSSPQEYFGLLWGSVDPYNDLTFYNSQGAVIGTVTGSDVADPTGSTGPDGTYYVNITSSTPFSEVVATSEKSFELDDVAYSAKLLPVPEPPSGAFMAWGLAIGFVAIAHKQAPKKRRKK